LEPLVARIERLALLVFRILSVLGDDDDAVDGKLARPERERVGDRVEAAQRMSLDAPSREVPFRALVDVDGGDLDARLLPLPAPAVAERHAIEEVLGVRMRAHLGAEERDLLLPRRALLCACAAKKGRRDARRRRA